MLNRRKEERIPFLDKIYHAIQLVIDKEVVPGIMVNLSSGGISIITFAKLKINQPINMAFKLQSLIIKSVSGKVVWCKKVGEMWRIGIAFTKIDPVNAQTINYMAADFAQCERKISLKEKNVCFNKCSYYRMCNKPQKITKTKK